jgi:hypothetical protein
LLLLKNVMRIGRITSVHQPGGGTMSRVRFVVESLKTTNYIIAAAAVAGTVMMPIPPARAGSAGIATTAATVPLPLPRPAQARTAGNAPLDLAAVARMAPAHIVARAQALAAGDTIGILTREQIVEFAKSNPAFVAKLQHAYMTGSVPPLTAEESQVLAAVSAAALGDIKAGNLPTLQTSGTDDNGNAHALAFFLLIFFIFLFVVFGIDLLYNITGTRIGGPTNPY